MDIEPFGYLSDDDSQFVGTCATEGLDAANALALIRRGELVFLRSRSSKEVQEFRPIFVGSKARKKVTALVGLGPNDKDWQSVIDQVTLLQASRPDAVIDLSTNPEGLKLRAQLKQIMNVPIGAGLTYDLFTEFRRPISRNEFLEKFEMGIDSGIDFALVHVGMTWKIIEQMKLSKRIMPTTSRGGALVSRYMETHKVENPLIEYLDDICRLCRKYEVVLDMGDIFRPGCIEDAEPDDLKMLEIEAIAEHRRRALDQGVQVLCESGGHIPIRLISKLIPKYKAALGGAPLWLAGPMVIDTGITLDSTVNTIGVAFAALNGGDMFASITDNEHYAMPTIPETAAAVRNVRVAIEAFEVSTEYPQTIARNREMGRARRLNSWKDQAELSIYPDLANQVFLQEGLLKDGKPCTICGHLCPHVIVKKDEETKPDLTILRTEQVAV